MKIGKIQDNILQRSVLKQLHTNRSDIVTKSTEGGDFASFSTSGRQVVTASHVAVGDFRVIVQDAMREVANNLACSGAEFLGAEATFLLPERLSEQKMRTMVQQLDLECKKRNGVVLGGHTQVSDLVEKPVLTICGFGLVEAERMIPIGKVKPGMDLVLTRYIALEGTLLLAKEYREVLQRRLPEDFLQRTDEFADYLETESEAAVAVKAGACAIHDVSGGGIYAALWELAEASGIGLEVNLKEIPIRQETVEICEILDINPYKLKSAGALLIAAKDGCAMVQALKEAGVPSCIIGRTQEGHMRMIQNDDESRYLEQPGIDEWSRIATTKNE